MNKDFQVQYLKGFLLRLNIEKNIEHKINSFIYF